MLGYLIIPTVIGWICTVLLQVGFIYYIAREVIDSRYADRDDVMEDGTDDSLRPGSALAIQCYGTGDQVQKILRLVCNLTFTGNSENVATVTCR